MLGLHRYSLLAILILPLTASATELFRYQAGDGSISFSQYGCPTGSQQQRQQLGKPNLSESRQHPSKPSKSRNKPEAQALVIVGEQDDGCGNLLSSRERRHHIIKKQIRSGMSRRDVENALGKPDRISSRNGKTQYQYAGQRINFDLTGCVSRK